MDAAANRAGGGGGTFYFILVVPAPVLQLSGRGIARLPAGFRLSGYLAGVLPGFWPGSGFPVIWPGNCPASGRVPVFRLSGRGIAWLPAGFRFSGYLAGELPGFRPGSGFLVIWPGKSRPGWGGKSIFYFILF